MLRAVLHSEKLVLVPVFGFYSNKYLRFKSTSNFIILYENNFGARSLYA